MDSIPGRVTKVSLCIHIDIGTVVHASSSLMATGALSRGIKWPQPKTGHLHPSTTKAKNARTCTFDLLCVVFNQTQAKYRIIQRISKWRNVTKLPDFLYESIKPAHKWTWTGVFLKKNQRLSRQSSFQLG